MAMKTMKVCVERGPNVDILCVKFPVPSMLSSVLYRTTHWLSFGHNEPHHYKKPLKKREKKRNWDLPGTSNY